MHGFFKIIISEISTKSKLIIPENFVKICEDELQERVLLKVPGGAAWPVDVERREGEVLLHNGWPNFAAFYSLQFGYLLVFDYIGHCNFQVRVFDTSATEINYPNLCEPSTPCKKKRARSASHKAFQSRPILKQEKATRNGVSASEEEKDRALASANAFKSNKPFFIVSMKQTYVVGRSLNIPKPFQNTFLKWKNRNRVVLQVAERSWKVDCTLMWDRCTLTRGWTHFNRENSLNVGDVCLFELRDSSRKLFEVFIFRAKPEATRSSSIGVHQ